MPYDTRVLQQIANPMAGPPPATHQPAAAAGAAPGGPAGKSQPQSSGAEPVQLHDLASAASEAVKAARKALEELSALADVADTIDAGAEKAIGKAVDQLVQIDEALDGALETLAAAREEHEEAVEGEGDSDDKGPPGKK